MDIQNPNKELDKELNKELNKELDNKLFCINCGKNGHNSKKCLCPIISIGIICFKINNNNFDLNSIIGYSKKIQNNYLFTHEELNKLKKLKNILDFVNIDDYNNIIEYLLIRRKNSLNYVEFIRGKYDINNLDYLERSINFMTIEEREMIKNNNFLVLWRNLWSKNYKDSDEPYYKYKNNVTNNIEYNDSNNKFNMLKKGLIIKRNDINITFNLDRLLNEAVYNFKEAEWGFPKGRRNSREKNIECAKREFEEETNINEVNYNIINMTPLEETYMASNNLKYKHIYYISQIKNNNYELLIDKDNFSQNIEIGDIKWLKFNDALLKIRDYNIEKKNVLLNLHLNIKYIIENFKLIVDIFLEKN
jgi:8-oxo-dGTP pyrophosphatase MutT (NUDIX family)